MWTENLSEIFARYGNCFIPEREQQIATIVDLLDCSNNNPFFVDLCCGEGNLLTAIAKKYTNAKLLGLDLSAHMLSHAKLKLDFCLDRIKLEQFELENTDWRKKLQKTGVDGIVSSLAIHHLNSMEKKQLFRDAYNILNKDGSFIIADLIKPASNNARKVAAKAWDAATQKRSLHYELDLSAFEKFKELHWNYHANSEEEQYSIDKPDSLFDQLQWLKEAGFSKVDVFWMQAGQAIFGGYKD